MSAPVRPPGTPIVHAVTLFVALLAGALVFLALRPIPKAPEELRQLLAGEPVVAHPAVAVVERGWLDDDGLFRPHYRIDRAAPPPCPSEIDYRAAPLAERRLAGEGLSLLQRNRGEQAVADLRAQRNSQRSGWLSTWVLGRILEQMDRPLEAKQVLEDFLAGSATQSTIQDLLTRAKGRRPNANRSLDEVSGLIHVLYSTGRLQLARNQGGKELWESLKHPIGLTKFLALRGDVGLVEGVPTTSKLWIPTPGCGVTDDSLTSYHLYNNLIVGYLVNEDYDETPGRLAYELHRNYDDSPADNPLQTVMKVAQADWRPRREHWVWAVSNAEQLLKEEADPTSSTLKLNLAQLMLEAVPRVEESIGVVARGEQTASFPEDSPPRIPETSSETVRALEREAVRLMASAERGWRGSPPEEAGEAIVRMKMLQAILTGEPLSVPRGLLAGLSQEQRETVTAVTASRELWSDPLAWLPEALAGEEDETRAILGGRAGPWLSAARQTGAAELARRAARVEGPEQENLVQAARLVLRSGDPVPATLAAMKGGSGLVAWLGRGGARTVAAILALLAAAVVGFAGYWLSLQRRAQRALFTSFYRLEAVELLRRQSRS